MVSTNNDDLLLMLQFGMFILTFLSLIVAIIKLLLDANKKK